MTSRPVDLDLLDDSDFVLTERYDPDGRLDESWVSCGVERWRTDFVAPRPGAPSAWCVRQWEWVLDEGADRAPEAMGEWVLRAESAVDADAVAATLPAPLHDWVRRMT
jgi:hypothetical protein